jgi:hypothetical protein
MPPAIAQPSFMSTMVSFRVVVRGAPVALSKSS